MLGKKNQQEEIVNTNEIIDSKELREELAGRIDVLEKVKQLLLIPETEYATIAVVAEYYQVSNESIRQIVVRNHDELAEDGLIAMKGKDILLNLVSDKMSHTNHKGYFDVGGVKIPYGASTLFPRRAILRIGMLLRDSEVAKEIRTQLLNTEEKAENPVKVSDINEEQRLAMNVGMALASGNTEETIKAFSEMVAFKNRHIEKLETTNKALSNSILEWEDRSRLNFAVRKLAGVSGQPYATMWNELYKQLRNKYHIDLKHRGKKPYISTIRKEEWSDLIKCFSALCQYYGQEPEDMFHDLVVK